MSEENGSTNKLRPRRGFTDEERAKSIEVRRRKREERRLTALDLIHKAVIEKAELVMRPYWDAMLAGDWRASADLLNRVYGKPGGERDTGQSVGVQELLKLSPQELHALRTHALAILQEASEREAGQGATIAAEPLPLPEADEGRDEEGG